MGIVVPAGRHRVALAVPAALVAARCAGVARGARRPGRVAARWARTASRRARGCTRLKASGAVARVRVMLDSTPGGPLPSQLLQERYGRGYFHGENSGFAHEGCAQVRVSGTGCRSCASRSASARGCSTSAARTAFGRRGARRGLRAVRSGVDASSRCAIGEARAWAPAAHGCSPRRRAPAVRRPELRRAHCVRRPRARAAPGAAARRGRARAASRRAADRRDTDPLLFDREGDVPPRTCHRGGCASSSARASRSACASSRRRGISRSSRGAARQRRQSPTMRSARMIPCCTSTRVRRATRAARGLRRAGPERTRVVGDGSAIPALNGKRRRSRSTLRDRARGAGRLWIDASTDG